ncbi:hypothetical protein EMCRGX_G012563 [Ephydatia muelleri]
MELSEDEQGDYGAAKQKMIKRMVLASFVSMDGFLKRRLRLEEALSLYLFELKWLLDQAMPGLDATAHSPLLLHQFMEGLPTVVSRQLRAAGDVKDLDTALERVRTLMTLEEGSTTVAAMEEKPREETQVQKLAHQITLLTEQVAALSNTARKTDYADHYISTTGSPIRVPSRHIPEQYRSEVEEQIKSMLQQDESQHKEHLNIVFQKLQGALRGKKCHIGMDKVFYLDTPFNWTTECDAAFQTLKQNLVQAPVLAYPRFDQDAAEASTNQNSNTVGMLSCGICSENSLTLLIGSPFSITTDHAPLQWLSAQKMEGLLCRWALAIQEYDFQIEYKKGSNADALSRRSVGAITHAGQPLDDMRKAQRDDPAIGIVYTTLLSKKTPTHSGKWRQHPLRRYQQLWSQLQLIDSIV